VQRGMTSGGDWNFAPLAEISSGIIAGFQAG
jgi:hypothetical protein